MLWPWTYEENEWNGTRKHCVKVNKRVLEKCLNPSMDLAQQGMVAKKEAVDIERETPS